MANYKYTYKSVIESEDKMLKDILSILEQNNIDGSNRQYFMLVISEAFTNAMIHGNKMDSKKEIKINISINENLLTADIIDEGKDGLKKINNRQPSIVLNEGGRGIDLINYYSNFVDYVELENGGLKVSIQICRKGNIKTINV